MTNQEHEAKKANPTSAGAGANAETRELQDGLGNLKIASEGSKGLSSATGETRLGLRRMDSETQEEDEFVDAES
jgi:hypothetical protein